MKTYHVTATCEEKIISRYGCYVEAESEEEARRIADEDGQWECEKELEYNGMDPIDPVEEYEVTEEARP